MDITVSDFFYKRMDGTEVSKEEFCVRVTFGYILIQIMLCSFVVRLLDSEAAEWVYLLTIKLYRRFIVFTLELGDLLLDLLDNIFEDH